MAPAQERPTLQNRCPLKPQDVLLLRLAPHVDEAMLLRMSTVSSSALSITLLPSDNAQQAVLAYASHGCAAKAVSYFNSFVDSPDLGQHPAFITDALHPTSTVAALGSDVVLLQFVPSSWEAKEVRQVFGNFGTVRACCIQRATTDYNVTEALVQMDSIASASRAILAIDSCGPSDPLGAAMGPFMHAHFFAGRQLAKSCLSSEHPQDVEERSRGRPVSANDIMGIGNDSIMTMGGHDLGPTTEGISSSIDLADSPSSEQTLPISALSAELARRDTSKTSAHVPSQPTEKPLGSLLTTSGADPETPKGLPQAPSNSRAPNSPSKSIYVSNLPPEAESLWVYERFAPYGGILSVKVLHDQRTGKCSGVCFVNYMEPCGAASAIQSLHGTRMAGRPLQVKLQQARR